MSAKWLITDGLANSPGSPKYIITMGLVPDGIAPIVTATGQNIANWLAPSLHLCLALFVWVRYGL